MPLQRGQDGRFVAGEAVPRPLSADEAVRTHRGRKRAFVAAAWSDRGWTPKKRDLFFGALSVTSNVTRSAAVTGMTREGAYYLRKTDPVFRQRWVAALAEGYAHLELEMLHRARFGAKSKTVESDAAGLKKKVVRKGFSDSVGLQLLDKHRATARLGDESFDAAVEGDDETVKLARLRALLDARKAALDGDAALDGNAALSGRAALNGDAA